MADRLAYLDLACAADPALFARLKLKNVDGERIEPDPWQERVLRSTAQQIILNNSRRSGKSTMAAVLATHTAIYQPGSTTIIISRSQDQAKELFSSASGFLKSCDNAPRMDADAMTRCRLVNGSRIISLASGDAVRGFTPSLIIVDEAAFVDSSTMTALRPMLALRRKSGRRARIILMSTPNGKQNDFFEAWANGGPRWHREQVTWDQCPRIDAEWIAEERQRIPEWTFRQEYECAFCDAEDQFFSDDIINAAFSHDLQPLHLSTIEQ